MLAQNGARINIVLGQKERWDYAEFKIECEKAGQSVLPISDWVQKVAMLTAGMLRWPGVIPEQAYQNFVYEMNTLTAQAIQEQRNIQAQRIPPNVPSVAVAPLDADCPTCGGGIVV